MPQDMSGEQEIGSTEETEGTDMTEEERSDNISALSGLTHSKHLQLLKDSQTHQVYP
jgi:hypothetical protein